MSQLLGHFGNERGFNDGRGFTKFCVDKNLSGSISTTGVLAIRTALGTATVLISCRYCSSFWGPSRVGFEHRVDGDEPFSKELKGPWSEVSPRIIFVIHEVSG